LHRAIASTQFWRAMAAILPATIGVMTWACSRAKADESPIAANLFTLRTAASFQDMCRHDYAQAIKKWGWQEARDNFEQLDQQLWHGISAQRGWSCFMSTAVTVNGFGEPNQPLIAFYDPKSDVFLVTMWTEQTAQPWLADAEVIVGEWFRRGTIPSKAEGGWLRNQQLEPVAAELTTAQSLRAFERRFGEAHRPWRAALPGLDDRQVRETSNYPRAAQLLQAALTRPDGCAPAP
jgi:hypothetical protein